jgi:hypothetical protein
MAKPIAARGVAIPRFNTPGPGTEVEEPLYWEQPKGLDLRDLLSKIDRDHGTEFRNLTIQEGRMESRVGTAAVGTGATNIMAVVNFIPPAGIGVLLRFTTTTVEAWDGTTWNAISGSPTLTGGLADYFSFASFGNKLLFTNGVDPLNSYDVGTNSFQVITEAPIGKHLTTFNGRIILSNTVEDATRIQWSEKNIEDDWDGDGAGFEDLLSTPGGKVDIQRGVFPITDFTALVVRSNSIWSMTVTGDPDAPHRFNRIYPTMGTDSPHSIQEIPGGIVGWFKDNVYVMSETQPVPIGDMVRKYIVENLDSSEKLVGVYDPDEREYRLRINSTEVFRYSFRDQSWTRDIYPVGIRWMEHSHTDKIGLTVDTATGTVDDAGTESVDSEFAVDVRRGVFYVTEQVTTNFVTEDDSTVETDHPAAAASTLIFATGSLHTDRPFNHLKVIEIQLEYEIDTFSQNFQFEYSLNKGATWASFGGAFSLTATTAPAIHRTEATVEGKSMIFRLRSATLGRFTLHRMMVSQVLEHRDKV